MAGLRDRRTEPTGPQEPVYPEAMAGSLLYGKPLYPPIHWREMERIVQRKCGEKTHQHPLNRFVAPSNPPLQLARDLPTFAPVAEAYQARWTVVRMAAEGWNTKRLADCLTLSRAPVETMLEACERAGVAGLEDQRTRPPQPPEHQRSLPVCTEV